MRMMMLNSDTGQTLFRRIARRQSATGEIGMQIAGNPLWLDLQDILQMRHSFLQSPAGGGVIEAADMSGEIGAIIAG